MKDTTRCPVLHLLSNRDATLSLTSRCADVDNKATQVDYLFRRKKKQRRTRKEKHQDLPQKGMPAGVQVPLEEQSRRDGPRSSKPGSHS